MHSFIEFIKEGLFDKLKQRVLSKYNHNNTNLTMFKSSVHKTLEKHYDYSNANPDEIETMRNHVLSDYNAYQPTYKNAQPRKASFVERMKHNKHIEHILNSGKWKTPIDLTVYHGVAKGPLGLYKHVMTAYKYIGKTMNPSFTINHKLSTSLDHNLASDFSTGFGRDFHGHVLALTVPKGTPSLYMENTIPSKVDGNKISSGEHELLLSKGKYTLTHSSEHVINGKTITMHHGYFTPNNS